MERPHLPDKTDPVEAGYFENYEVCSNDLETLSQGIDLLSESQLLEEGTLDEIRFVTYDSKCLYVFTRGEHVSNDRFLVQELSSPNKSGMRLFKIPRAAPISMEKKDYRAAQAWLLCEELESTAVNARRLPNENLLRQPGLAQPETILDVVSMSPFEAYERARKKNANHLTDVVFHEAAHIEHRHWDHWQKGEPKVPAFPSAEGKTRFLALIRQNSLFPKEITNRIIRRISRVAMCEMVAMLVDREGARRYDDFKFSSENTRFELQLAQLRSDSPDPEILEDFIDSFKHPHVTGRLLVRMLEDQLPDYTERKAFVRSVLDRRPGGPESEAKPQP